MRLAIALSLAILSLGRHHSAPADDTVPGALDSYSTVYSIGLEWEITGDDDHDAVCTVQYRSLSSTAFKPALPLYRVDFQGYNTMAGSIFFLEPGTSYEVLLNLSDPDGGTATVIDTIATMAIPTLPSSGSTYHVIPGNGGGDGTIANPFQGIESAEAVAGPGDICLLHAGDYGGTIFFNTAGVQDTPIVWTDFGDGPAILQGARIEADFIWLDGLTIVDQQYGIRTSAPGPEGIVVTKCTFENNHYSIYLNDGGVNWYIADNLITGDNDPNNSNFSGEGVELWYTSGHTVAYNTISRVADGISYPHRNVDMLGNDIFDTSDDGIEFDYGHANIRAWRNRITNALNNGISFQPQNGAPYYVLYNQVSVLGTQSVLKLRDRSDRALIAHNTFVCNSGPMSYGSHFLVDFEIKNNLWISIKDRYAWENGVQGGTSWKTDFDNDGFDWGSYQYAFKWGERLDDIPEFNDSTGQEVNGIQIDHEVCLDSLGYSVEGDGVTVDSFFHEYYVLDSTCNAVDAGTFLPNINDVIAGTAPDLGAYEIGKSLPHYGVRQICYTTKTNVWIGPSSGGWHDTPANWSLGKIPQTCHKVMIPPGSDVTIATGHIAEAHSVEVEITGDLTVSPGAELRLARR